MNRVLEYLREVRAELKKVQWPDRRETAVSTAVVIVSVAIVAVIIWIMDLALGGLLRLII